MGATSWGICMETQGYCEKFRLNDWHDGWPALIIKFRTAWSDSSGAQNCVRRDSFGSIWEPQCIHSTITSELSSLLFFHINMCHFEIAFSTSFFSSPWDDWTPNTFASTTKEMPPRMLFSVLIKDVSTLKLPGAIRACATCSTRGAAQA